MSIENTNNQTQENVAAIAKDPLLEDFKTSVVIVSLFANLVVFVAWLTTIVA